MVESSRSDNDDAASRDIEDFGNLDMSNEISELDHNVSFRACCNDFGSHQFYTLAEEQTGNALASNEFALNESWESEETNNFTDHRASTSVHAALPQTSNTDPRTYWNHPTIYAEVAEVPNEDLPSVMQTIETTNHPFVVKTSRGLALLLNHDGSNTITIPQKHQQQQPIAANLTSKSSLSLPPNTDRKFQRWSEEEDDILKQAVRIEGGPPTNWKRIAQKYFGNSRTGLQCKSRYTKVRFLFYQKINSKSIGFLSHIFLLSILQSLQPGIVRGTWRPEEDAYILQCKEDGLKWSEIAELLPGRIGEHIRDRYVNVLDPNLKKTPWTPEEDQLLFQEQRRIGNKWTQISTVIPGRSENAVKNRWHNLKMTQRRKLRKEAADRKRQGEYQTAGARTRVYSSPSRGMMEESFSGDDYSSILYSV